MKHLFCKMHMGISIAGIIPDHMHGQKKLQTHFVDLIMAVCPLESERVIGYQVVALHQSSVNLSTQLPFFSLSFQLFFTYPPPPSPFETEKK